MAVVSSTSAPAIPPCVPGPSGLQGDASSSVEGHDLHTVTSSAIQEAGGESTSNGNSDTPKRPKKRPRRPEHWKKNVTKAKRAKGEAYISPSTGKEVPARETRPACKCQRKCYEAFSDAERGDLLQRFNDLGNKEVQDAYLFGLISSRPIQRRRPRRSAGRARRLLSCKCVDCYY